VSFDTVRPALAHKTTRRNSGLVQRPGNDLKIAPPAILPASSGVQYPHYGYRFIVSNTKTSNSYSDGASKVTNRRGHDAGGSAIEISCANQGERE